MKRKIAAILAADIAGYSRLVAEDEEETLHRLGIYRAVFDDFVARYGGRIFNTAGDATLAEFPSAVDAIRCAVDVQESLRTRNLAYALSRQMSFRIGITIGDIVERDGDLLGDGVNIASRLEGVAPAGGICISQAVREAVTNKVSLKFDDLGLLALKNIPDRVHAYQVALAPQRSRPVWSIVSGTAAAAVLLIAVAGAGWYVFTQSRLPFASLSPTGDAEPHRASPSPPGEGKSASETADRDVSKNLNSGAATPANVTALPTAVGRAPPPAVAQSQSALPETSAPGVASEETCRRYLPSIGKTVEVDCEDGMQAATPANTPAGMSDTAQPPQAELAHPFKDMWGNSLAACKRDYGDWRKSDRLIIFGVGTLQYIRLDGQGQICQSAQIENKLGTFSLRAHCLASPTFIYLGKRYRDAVEASDITLAGDGQKLVGIGPDGQSLQLTKCN